VLNAGQGVSGHPVEAQFGLLRTCAVGSFDHRNHTVLAGASVARLGSWQVGPRRGRPGDGVGRGRGDVVPQAGVSRGDLVGLVVSPTLGVGPSSTVAAYEVVSLRSTARKRAVISRG